MRLTPVDGLFGVTVMFMFVGSVPAFGQAGMSLSLDCVRTCALFWPCASSYEGEKVPGGSFHKHGTFISAPVLITANPWRMKTHLNHRFNQGKIGWVFLWLIGIPVPVLLVLYLLRGCT